MQCHFSNNSIEDINEVMIEGCVIPKSDSFWYLSLIINKGGGIEENVKHRNRVGCMD